MEISKEPDYRYYKTYFYPVDKPSEEVYEPWGTAEIQVYGKKGRLTCLTRECLGHIMGLHPQLKFPVMLHKIPDGETMCIGSLSVDQTGSGSYQWDFGVLAPGTQSSEGSETTYKIAILANKLSVCRDGINGTLMEGIVTLPFEARDNRVVGFNREAKVRKAAREADEKNPFMQKVEPFSPPMPNSVWWQIGIQPDFRYYGQADFCPRQKSNRAVF